MFHDSGIVHHGHIVNGPGGYAMVRRMIPPVGRARMVWVPNNYFVSMPVAILVQPRSHDQPRAEGNKESPWCRRPLHIDHLRLIHRHIDHLRSGRDNLDDPTVNHYGLLWCGKQVAHGLGLRAQALDRVHNVGWLVEKGLSQVGRPSEVFIQHPERGGIPCQGLQAIVPWLEIHLVQIPTFTQITVGQDDLRGQGRRRQEFRQQWVRVKRDGR